MSTPFALATSLADLPLNASVLAKPNVIFGLDDSGSMDFEVLLYNNDGALWWDFNARSGWGVDPAHPNTSLRTITSTWFNDAGGANNQWRKMAYLFPMGLGTGNQVNDWGGYQHFAVLPTREFAFLRWSGIRYDAALQNYIGPPSSPAQSPVHNPLYYNTLINYAPWAPAQLSSGAYAPVAASPTAAKSHPVLGSTTVNLKVDIPVNTADAGSFVALPGMTIPAGASKSVCDDKANNCGNWTSVSSDQTAATGKVTLVRLAYYAPTFWVKESCTPENVSAMGDSCTTAPDGSRLKRYEIKSGNTFPSGRTYAAEVQNFANWFQYYRKRKLMLSAAMGATLENLAGMRLGVTTFNPPGNVRSDVRMYDADSEDATQNRLRVAGIFYETEAGGGTPTRETLDFIGQQFQRTDKTAGQYNVVQLSCQRNNAFIVTDGFANDSDVSPPAWDTGKSAASWGSGPPYEADFQRNGILADLALRYYTNNPRPDLARGRLRDGPVDHNLNLHMNTYALTLGARGTVFLGEGTPPPTRTSAWPDPDASRSPKSVDDLWRATLSGRGQMYLATNPEETAARVKAGLDDILGQPGAQASAAVSSVNLGRSDGQAYFGSYNPAGWTGDVVAQTLNASTGAISGTVLWSANTLLGARTWGDRRIFTSSGSSGVDFSAANVGATVNPPPTGYTNAQVVNYLRGSRSGEGSTFRLRAGLLGPVVNAEPVVAREEGVVYVASGEGLLHAFATTTGEELWAYAPPDALAGMGSSVDRGWTYRALLDATPVYGRLSNGDKMLAGGMGVAGSSWYALNVSNPTGLTAAQAQAQFRWVFPAATDTTNRSYMGYSVGKPVFTRVSVAGVLKDVVLVTSGYDNGVSVGDGKGRLWMLDAATGAVLKTFTTSEGTAGAAEAGLAQLAAYREADGSVRYAYGGDLLGNIWRFNLAVVGTTVTEAAVLVATLKDDVGNRQPVTATPELVTIGGKRIILIGTGRLLDATDFGSTREQSFYAIADGSTLSNARSGLVARTFNSTATPQLSGTAVNWTTDRGWYFDLPAGQQVNTEAMAAYGAVVFAGNTIGSTNCSQSSAQYLVDITQGKQVENATSVSATLSTGAISSRLLITRDTSGRLRSYGRLSDGTTKITVLPMGATISPLKNAWREIRR